MGSFSSYHIEYHAFMGTQHDVADRLVHRLYADVRKIPYSGFHSRNNTTFGYHGIKETHRRA